MKRVMIVGGSGSGKSTLARWLGVQTGLRVHHMDRIQWTAGWQSRTRDTRRVMAQEVEALDSWIFEGGFSTTYGNRFARADTFIWIDLPVGMRLWRVTKRLVQHWGKGRPDMADGCVEKFHGETLKFYKWIWDTRHSHRRLLLPMVQEEHADTQVFHLRSRAEVAAFQECIRTAV